MKIIFYGSGSLSVDQKVQGMLMTHVPMEGLETYRSAHDLARRFRYRSHDVEAAVFIASELQELRALINLRALFEDTRIILILPTSEAQLVSQGHLLYPRFIGYADGNLNDIDAVIEKLFGAVQSQFRR